MMSSQVIINTFVFVSIIILFAIAETIGPNKVGFWCNDESIRHNFIPQVIDFRILLAVVFTVPVLAFALLDRPAFKTHLRNYYYGAIMNIFLTQYCKLVIGRPRPNFHSICKPVWEDETIKCSPEDKHFITDYTCANPRRWLAHNSNQSFFSGHSSLGTYTAFALIFFLNDKLRVNGFLKAHIFIIVFMFGLLPGLTQYLNFWHFASDVITGDLVGIMLAIFEHYTIPALDRSSSLVQKSKTLKTNS